MNYFSANFVPLEVKRECQSKEEAIQCIELLHEIATHLSKSYAVYKRTEPHYLTEKDFASQTESYQVRARIVIGPPEVGIGFR